MGMRGKREAGIREEAGLSQGTEKEKLRVTGSPIGSRILRKTESVRWTVLLRKAMNLNETEDAPSSERRILGGIGESRKGDESGRSMVETLGVLAIMGLLAIGGIIGYRWAMDKYRATDTINELNRRAIVHSTQLMMTQTLNALEFPEETRMGYRVETSLLSGEKAGYFEIALNGVEGGVCREILKADWVWPILKRANGIEYDGDVGICRTDTGVRMAFVFPGDLSGKEGDFRQRCEKDADCRSGCGICEGGYCESQCGEGTTCARTYDNADFYACCMNEKILNGICCPMISNGRCCASIGSCCPSERPLMDKDGNCHECGEENPVNVTGNTVMCGICDGQEGRTKRDTCVLPCPPETPLMDSSGNCHRCDEYKHISVVNSTKCLSVCDGSDDDIHMERTWFGAYAQCVYPCADNEVTASLGNEPCYPCSTQYAFFITFRPETECITKCDGSSEDRPKRRRLAYSNGHSVCMLDECPATHPIQDRDGTCHACTDASIPVGGVEENCFKCPNRALRGTICIMADKCPKGTHADETVNVCVMIRHRFRIGTEIVIAVIRIQLLMCREFPKTVMCVRGVVLQRLFMPVLQNV